jgi:aerobic-type carbon monoxide dehydrogenase small subunit (CoxS/CutS family)
VRNVFGLEQETSAALAWLVMPMLTLLVNGTERKVEAQAGEPLLWVLRDGLGLTGTKYGCGEGQCGACTVLLDGKPVRSCRTAAESATGKKILTIESLAENGKLTPLQQAFLDEEAFQCGYCTPGMIMSAHALLSATPQPSDEEIIRQMNGNVCRCGTYPRIVAAIHRAAGGKKG